MCPVRNNIAAMDLRYYIKHVARETQTAFAKRIGVSQMAISHYVTGRRIPSTRVLSRIQEATGGQVTLNDFVQPERLAS